MFTYSRISSLNELELLVYSYVIKHGDKVIYMTIRELAQAVQVSTTTVLRFCKKMECDGYAEFRQRFSQHLQQKIETPAERQGNEIEETIQYLHSFNSPEFEADIQHAVQLISAARRVIFIGTGTSGTLGKYGARFFSNVGTFSHHIDDPYYPINRELYENTLVIILSVSGETTETLRFASQFSLNHCKVISITNNENSALAKMADFNLSYHVPRLMINGDYNITTQVPVILLIELIGRRLAMINSQ